MNEHFKKSIAYSQHRDMFENYTPKQSISNSQQSPSDFGLVTAEQEKMIVDLAKELHYSGVIFKDLNEFNEDSVLVSFVDYYGVTFDVEIEKHTDFSKSDMIQNLKSLHSSYEAMQSKIREIISIAGNAGRFVSAYMYEINVDNETYIQISIDPDEIEILESYTEDDIPLVMFAEVRDSEDSEEFEEIEFDEIADVIEFINNWGD